MRAFLVLVSLGFAASVSAQTHPCDVQPPPATIMARTVIVGWCHDQKDTNGDPTVILAFKVKIGATIVVTQTNPVPKIANPNTNGQYYYETGAVPVTKGNNQVVSVNAVDADGESAFTPFSFSVKGPGPKAPVSPRVQ